MFFNMHAVQHTLMMHYPFVNGRLRILKQCKNINFNLLITSNLHTKRTLNSNRF